MAHPPKDISNQTFGNLTALYRVGSVVRYGRTRALWNCECSCGSQVEVTSRDLIMGSRKSCGCLKPGMSRTKVYQAWADMKQRCLNPMNSRFKDYGERGLKLEAAWIEAPIGFQNFYEEVGDPPTPEHTLERIDNDLGYVAGNVCWSLPHEQSRNRRSNHLVEYKGRTQCLTDWAIELGVLPKTLSTRINTYKWPIERAFETPVRDIVRTGCRCPDWLVELAEDS